MHKWRKLWLIINLIIKKGIHDMLFNGKSAAKRTYCVYIMGFESIFIQWDFPGGPVAKTLHS